MYDRKGDICTAIHFELFQDLRLTMYLKMLFIIQEVTSFLSLRSSIRRDFHFLWQYVTCWFERIEKQFISPKFLRRNGYNYSSPMFSFQVRFPQGYLLSWIHEVLQYKSFPENLFFLSFSSRTLSLNKFRVYIQIIFQMCRGS